MKPMRSILLCSSLLILPAAHATDAELGVRTVDHEARAECASIMSRLSALEDIMSTPLASIVHDPVSGILVRNQLGVLVDLLDTLLHGDEEVGDGEYRNIDTDTQFQGKLAELVTSGEAWLLSLAQYVAQLSQADGSADRDELQGSTSLMLEKADALLSDLSEILDDSNSQREEAASPQCRMSEVEALSTTFDRLIELVRRYDNGWEAVRVDQEVSGFQGFLRDVSDLSVGLGHVEQKPEGLPQEVASLWDMVASHRPPLQGCLERQLDQLQAQVPEYLGALQAWMTVSFDVDKENAAKRELYGFQGQSVIAQANEMLRSLYRTMDALQLIFRWQSYLRNFEDVGLSPEEVILFSGALTHMELINISGRFDAEYDEMMREAYEFLYVMEFWRGNIEALERELATLQMSSDSLWQEIEEGSDRDTGEVQAEFNDVDLLLYKAKRQLGLLRKLYMEH